MAADKPLADIEDDAGDEFDAKLGEIFDGIGTDDDESDTGGMDRPLEEVPGDEVISAKDGQKAVDDAALAKERRTARAKPEKADAEEPEADSEAETDSKADTAAAGDKTPGEGDAAEPADDAKDQKVDGKDPSDLSAMDPAKLLDGLDEPRAKEVRRRLGDAARVMALFEPHAEEIKRHGTTPEGAVRRFLQLNQLAQQSPDEYIAWVAQQMGGEKAPEVLQQAASRLGYKVVPADDGADEDDEFADEETLQLRKRVKELERERQQMQAGTSPGFGPDTPERRAAMEIEAWANSRDEFGRPLYPELNVLVPDISRLAQAHAQQHGTPPTPADLDRFYKVADQALRQRLGVPPQQPAEAKIAAQATPPAAQEDKDAARRARASKSIDGQGQSARRRPAAVGPDIDDAIKAALADQGL